MQSPLGFWPGAGRSRVQKGCSGDGQRVQWGAVPSFSSAEPRLPCSRMDQTRSSKPRVSSPTSRRGGPLEAGPRLPPRPRAVRASAAAIPPRGSRPSPPPPTRGRPRPQLGSRAPRRGRGCGAGRVREALGALRPGTRGESCGPRDSGLGGAVGVGGAAGGTGRRGTGARVPSRENPLLGPAQAAAPFPFDLHLASYPGTPLLPLPGPGSSRHLNSDSQSSWGSRGRPRAGHSVPRPRARRSPGSRSGSRASAGPPPRYSAGRRSAGRGREERLIHSFTHSFIQ